MPRRRAPSRQAPAVLSVANNPAEFLVEFSLSNACAVFFSDRTSQFRSQFISLDGVEAIIHGFTEYTFGG